MNVIKQYNSFDVERITLANPIRSNGGGYYSSILLDDKSSNTLLIQTPKCSSKNGVVTSGKKVHSDMLFRNDNTDKHFISFINKIEDHIKTLLHNKSTDWFENKMELDDIEYFFNSSLRVYKEEFFLFRTFIENNKLAGQVEIYDQNERPLEFSDVCDKNIISIIQIKGIKFTNSSFHIEVNVKQIMVLDDIKDKQPNKCLIDTNTHVLDASVHEKMEMNSSILDKDNDCETIGSDREIEEEDKDIKDTHEDEDTDKQDIKDTHEDENEDEDEDIEEKKNKEIDILEYIKINPTEDEIITLRNPNDIYMEVYQEAKKRAREAKKKAIVAYLEAKHIKNTYMIDSINDSTSDEEDLDNLSDNTDISYQNLL